MVHQNRFRDKLINEKGSSPINAYFGLLDNVIQELLEGMAVFIIATDMLQYCENI